MVAVALELQDAVDEMLEHARSGDRPVLGDMADEKRRDAGLLGDPQQPRRRLAHLGDGAGRGADLLRPERLHRVDHADGGALTFERGAHRVQLGLGQDLHVVAAPEPGRPQLDLRDRLLAGHEQRPAVARDRAQRSEEQRRLADTGLAADEHERGRNQAAPEHAVELRYAGGDPIGLLGHDVDQAKRRDQGDQRRSGRSTALRQSLELHRPELSAARAATEPAARRRAAFGTRVLDCRCLRHHVTVETAADGTGAGLRTICPQATRTRLATDRFSECQAASSGRSAAWWSSAPRFAARWPLRCSPRGSAMRHRSKPSGRARRSERSSGRSV